MYPTEDEPETPRPVPEHLKAFDQEFEDEEPGSYLSELGQSVALPLWSTVNALLVVTWGILGWTVDIAENHIMEEWLPVGKFVWALLLPSVLLALVIGVWSLGNFYAREARPRTIGAVLASTFALGVWIVLRWTLPLHPLFGGE